MSQNMTSRKVFLAVLFLFVSSLQAVTFPAFKFDEFMRNPIVLDDNNNYKIQIGNIRNRANVFQKEHLKENEVEITDEEFDNIGSVSSLDDLIRQLGLRQEEELPHHHAIFPEVAPSTASVISSSRGFSPFGPTSYTVSTSDGPFHKKATDKYPENGLGTPGPHATGGDSRSSQPVRYISNPERAGCLPEPRTVELPLTEKAGTTYFPTCVRLGRCGGCCPNKEIRECQPITTQEVLVKIVQIEQRSGNRVNRSPPRRGRTGRRRTRRRDNLTIGYSYVNVSMVEHTKCDCKCRKSESDCDLLTQRFDEAQCDCVCKNTDDKLKCSTRLGTHLWNPHTCSCQCLKNNHLRNLCSCGEEFSETLCQCVPIRGIDERRNGRTNFNC